MILIKRKHGSQRASAPVKITTEPNWCGQGGSPNIVFKDENGDWITIKPETREDVRELMSQAHIVAGNFREPRNGGST